MVRSKQKIPVSPKRKTSYRFLKFVKTHFAKKREFSDKLLQYNQAYDTGGPDSVTNKYQKELLELQIILDFNYRWFCSIAARIYAIVFIVFLLIILIYIVFFLLGRMSVSTIYADILLTEVFLPAQAKTDNDDSQPNFHFKNVKEISVDVLNADRESKLNGHYTLVNGSPSAVTGINLLFRLPPDCHLSIASESDRLYLRLMPLKNTAFSYTLEAERYTEKSQDSSLIITDGIKMYEGDSLLAVQEINITLTGSDQFKMPGLLMDELRFKKIVNHSENVSLIRSGAIRLLDTKEDSIVLYKEDVLEIKPFKTVKADLNSEDDGMRIRFTAKVSQLKTGSSVNDNYVKNVLPLKIKSNYEKAPYLWIVIPVFLSLIVGFFTNRNN